MSLSLDIYSPKTISMKTISIGPSAFAIIKYLKTSSINNHLLHKFSIKKPHYQLSGMSYSPKKGIS